MIRNFLGRATAPAAFLLPLLASLGANVTWGVRTGSTILVVAGVLTPLLLMLAIERWRQLPVLVGFKWWARTLAMAGAVVAVGGWSWLHTALLLISELPPEPNRLVHRLEIALCIAAVLPVDGLAVLSVLSLQRAPGEAAPVAVAVHAEQAQPVDTAQNTAATSPAVDDTSTASSAEPAGQPPADTSAGDAAPDSTPPAIDQARAWYVDQLRQGNEPTAAAVNRAVGTSPTYIRKPTLEKWRADEEPTTNGYAFTGRTAT